MEKQQLNMAEEIQKPAASTAVVKQGPKATLKSLLEGEGFKSEIKKALAGVKISPEGFVRAALTAAVRNPQLYKVSPDSLWQCLFDVAQMGLLPDGRRAHLVPFWNSEKSEHQCQLIVDYKGIAELARKNGDVVYIHADVVHKGEHYVCTYGTDGKLEHIQDSEFEDEPVTHAYSHVKFLIPGTEVLVQEYTQMSIKAIEKIRLRSKSKDKGPWKTDYEEMCKKTVFRRHSKTLALSPETRAAVEYGEEQEFGGFRSAIPAIVPKRPELVEVEQEGDVEELTKREEVEKPLEKPRKRATSASKSVPVEKVQEPEPERDSRGTPPVITPESEDSLFADDDGGTKIQKPLSQVLDLMIKGSGIDRNSFFEYLNDVGLTHVKDPKLKILTYVDMKPTDLAATIENWEANLEDYRNWEAHLGKGENVA